MTKLLWDQTREHLFETGVDRAVLYLADRTGVAWNGLTSIVEVMGTRTLTPSYHDGVKFADTQTVGEYNGTLNAFTYPDEFSEYDGGLEFDDGILFKHQALTRFHLVYRTLMGNDQDGATGGYKLHILFNLLAVPADVTYNTLNDATTPSAFSWTLSSVPETMAGYRPVSHIVFDSTKLDPDFLLDLEDALYGNSGNPAYLPNLSGLLQLIDYLQTRTGITIIDNGDGTWTAVGSDRYFTMVSDTEFVLNNAAALYFDANTYEITTGSTD